jgi:ATP-dependent RNA helicase HelY
MKPTRMHPEAEPLLKRVFEQIGRPRPSDFIPDPFQLEALEAIKAGDCLVSAPTGAGKTWIAEQAIQAVFAAGGRCWYASPLKALSNAKWVEFGFHFEAANVGILTGDVKENIEAPIVVGTTEILRNQLYDVMNRGGDFNCDLVILDEAHYLGDYDRGVVWEEVMIYLPARVNLLLLSATIGNCGEIADWLSSVRGKRCRVIAEMKRPVPLYPLFLHPSGRIMPLLEKRKLFPKVKDHVLEGPDQPLRGRHYPRFGEIMDCLRKFKLLPAIFFLKSRAECDGALKACRHMQTPFSDDGEFQKDLGELLQRSPYLNHHRQISDLRQFRVAAHHGGQLPAWKFLVETMMKNGHLDAIFATSTVAAGVNYPARTIILCNSDLFNGHAFAPLNGTEFHQMTGRAGRRGLDKIGFLMLLPGRFMDVDHIRSLLLGGVEDVQSRIRSDFSMILNLLLSQRPEDIRQILEKSLAVYQQRNRPQGENDRTGASLWNDFQRHLAFLKAEGFVDQSDHLTENGLWASRLRLDEPLLIAECIRQKSFPDDERLFAAMVAPFVYDGDQDLLLGERRRPARRLLQASRIVLKAIRPLRARMETAGFPAHPFYLWTASVMYDWAKGKDWEEIIRQTGITDGELAMLILRTADNLRQIRSLRDTHPEMSILAEGAIEAILREPVLF